MQAVAKHIRFKACFPSFHFFPSKVRIRQIGQLIARIDGGRIAKHSSKSIFKQRLSRISSIQILIAQRTPGTFQLQHIQPRNVFHKLFFGHQPSGTCRVKVLPLVARIRKSRRTVPTERPVEQIFSFVIINHTPQKRNSSTFPLCTSIVSCSQITNTDEPFIGIIGNNQSNTLPTGGIQTAERIVISSETGGCRQIKVAKTISISQHIITLHLRFIFLELAHFSLTRSQCSHISFHCVIIYLDNRLIGTPVIRAVIHREHSPEIKMFQKIHLSINVTRCTIILCASGVGF